MNEQRVREIVKEELNKSTTKKVADFGVCFNMSASENDIKDLSKKIIELTQNHMR